MRSILDSIGHFQKGGSAKGQPVNEQVQRPVDEGLTLRDALVVRNRLSSASKPDAEAVRLVRENIQRVVGSELTDKVAYDLTETILRTHQPKDFAQISDQQWVGFLRKPRFPAG
jgi:hypothetical protein